MTIDRRPFRFSGGLHSHPTGEFCAECEVYAVLRNVEGFHEEIHGLTSQANLDDDSGGVMPSDQVVHAVEAAALRGFLMGIDLDTRRPISPARLKAIDKACTSFLE